MKINKRINEEKRENEREHLIDVLVEKIFEYRLFLKNGYESLNKNFSNRIFENLNLNYYAKETLSNKKIDESLRLEILNRQFDDLLNSLDKINSIKQAQKNLSNKQSEIIKIIEELNHFYSIPKKNRKEIKKIRKLKKSLVNLKIVDFNYQPLYKLDGAKDAMKMFGYDKNIDSVKKYLINERNENLIKDKNGFYQIDISFFEHESLEYKNNVSKIYKENLRLLNKSLDKHNTETKLKRYLMY